MDSLTTLANSLPTSNLANAEKDLLNTFKAAALSITTLYRSSRHTSKRAYNAGYAAACTDLLRVIEQGVSDRGGGDEGAGGMSVGRVMDWVEARLAAIRAREEEEDEEEERERMRAEGRSAQAQAQAQGQAQGGTTGQGQQGQGQGQRRTQPGQAEVREASPLPPPTSTNTAAPAAAPIPAAPPACTPSSSIASPLIARPMHPLPSSHRQPKSRSKDAPLPPSGSFTFPLGASSLNGADAPPVISRSGDGGAPVDVGAGAKRRHAMMMLLDGGGAESSVDVAPPAGPNSRRRARGARNGNSGNGQGRELEAMDIEEDGGRERKRVARR